MSRTSLVVAVTMMVAGCDCGDGMGTDGGPTGDGPTTGMDGPTTGVDGPTGVDAPTTGMDGMTGVDSPTTGVDGSPGPCVETPCQGHIRECGDCMDNDGDDAIDQDDVDCLGPCANDETGYYADIPGSPPTNCTRDCYFDQDDGSGNDTCQWDFQCDPLEPGPERCMYRDPPPPSASCPDPQTMMCHDVCGPLTPNGCDCFGCCELPGGSGNFVYVGSWDPDTMMGTCRLGDEDDVALCHPCTPVSDCLNTCERCEICLGRTAEDLPDDCFPPPPPADGGVPPGTDGGPPPPDGGTPPPPTCSDGRQACDIPGTGPCPPTYFCITGCCTYFG